MKRILLFLLPCLLGIVSSCNKSGPQQENNGTNSYSVDLSFEGDGLDSVVLTITSAMGEKDLDIKADGDYTYAWTDPFTGSLSRRSSEFGPSRKHAEKNMRIEVGRIIMKDDVSINLTVEFLRTREQLAKDLFSADISGNLGTGISATTPVDCKVEYNVIGLLPSFVTGDITINGNRIY